MRKQFLLFISIAVSGLAFSQTDSLLSIDTVESKEIKDASEPVFNGREHLQYHPSIEGIAYYQTTEWQKGTLVFRDILYKDVFLKYDLVKDEAIIQHINGFTGVTLFTPRIKAFTLENKKFIYLPGNNEFVQPGIYEELVNGRLSLYAKRSKIIKETVVSTGVERKFIDRNDFYVLREGEFYHIKKEKAMMDLVKEKKDEISSLLKEAGIKHKQHPEAALIKMVEYYNLLSR